MHKTLKDQITIGRFGLAYLSLSTYISFVQQFGRAYEKTTYDIVRTLFSAYIHKFSKIANENSL